MFGDDTRALRERLERAIEKDKPKDAIELLLRLEQAEPTKARWPHRRGDLHRKLAQKKEAIDAYDAAVALYAQEGFITRAVALAKLILDLDPSRADVLARVDPDAARRLRQRRPVVSGRGPIDFAGEEPTLSAPVPSAPAPANQEVEIEGEIDLSEIEVEAKHAQPLPPAGVRGDDAAPTAGELAAMPAFPLFADLPRDALILLLRGADLVELSHGVHVVRQGEPADELYAIVEGGVVVEVPGLPPDALPYLGEGDVFGESCLLENEPRKADVVVQNRLFALRIPRAVLKSVVGRFPQMGDTLFQLLTRRLIGNLLQSSPLFGAFDPNTRRELATLFELHRLPAGAELLKEGQRAGGLYIPLTGRVGLTRAGARSIAGPGTILGQQSLFLQQPSDVTAAALSELAALCLPAASFAKVASQYPPILEHLAELAAEPSTARAIDGPGLL
jgi:CRP-like cAMP-binding protein